MTTTMPKLSPYTAAEHYAFVAKCDMFTSIIKMLGKTLETGEVKFDTLEKGLETLTEKEAELAKQNGDMEAAITMLEVLTEGPLAEMVRADDLPAMKETMQWLSKTTKHQRVIIELITETRRNIQAQIQGTKVPADATIN